MTKLGLFLNAGNIPLLAHYCNNTHITHLMPHYLRWDRIVSSSTYFVMPPMLRTHISGIYHGCYLVLVSET